MNRVSLDTIGIAGFAHDFGSLGGKSNTIQEVFNSVGTMKPSPLALALFLLGTKLPLISRIPNQRNKTFDRMREASQSIADELIAKSKAEKAAGGMDSELSRSMIGALCEYITLLSLQEF